MHQHKLRLLVDFFSFVGKINVHLTKEKSKYIKAVEFQSLKQVGLKFYPCSKRNVFNFESHLAITASLFFKSFLPSIHFVSSESATGFLIILLVDLKGKEISNYFNNEQLWSKYSLCLSCGAMYWSCESSIYLHICAYNKFLFVYNMTRWFLEWSIDY